MLASRQTPTERKEPSKILFDKVGMSFLSSERWFVPAPTNAVPTLIQLTHVVEARTDDAKEVHCLLVQFMRNTRFPNRLLTPRLQLRLEGPITMDKEEPSQ